MKRNTTNDAYWKTSYCLDFPYEATVRKSYPYMGSDYGIFEITKRTPEQAITHVINSILDEVESVF